MSAVAITHPADIAFCQVAQGALCNDTVLPSGFRTPDVDMEIRGTELVAVDYDEWAARTQPVRDAMTQEGGAE